MDGDPPRGDDGGDGAGEAARHRRHLARGFNWLGAAAIVAKATDVAAILVVLLYLTQHQVGIGSLVVSFGMMIEAFDGLGTGDAIVQAREIGRRQLDGLFWYIMAIALAMAGLTLLAAPLVQGFYHAPGMAALFVAVAAKQPLVGAAVIPMALLNRELRYERIAVVNVAATFGAALTRLVVAVAGGGAWSLVAGSLAAGAFTLAGSLVARPFLPSLRFLASPQSGSIRPLVRFGLRSAGAHVADQVFKNIDFLLVGWFYGATPLALYRVVFDIAMEPAMAVGTLVNRTALPIFARVAAVPGELRAALLWSLRRLATLVVPFMTGVGFLALPLLSLLHDSQGHSYAAGAPALRVLAVAAVLRVAAQLFPPLLLATGRPGTAAWFSTATLCMLATGILAVGSAVPAPAGLVGIAGIWLALYLPLIAWGVRDLAGRWGIRAGELASPFRRPALAGAGVAAAGWALALLGPDAAVARIAGVLAAAALAYAWLFRGAGATP